MAEGFDVLQSTVFLTAVSAIIIFVISIVKGLVGRTSWGCKLPGEVWIGVSIVFGMLIAVLANFNAIESVLGASPDGSGSIPLVLSQGLGGKLLTGLLVGLQTKVVYSVSTPIAAKLKSVKEENRVKTEIAKNEGVAISSAPVCVPTPIAVSNPVIVAETKILPDPNTVKEIAIGKTITNQGVAYVILDGVAYKYQPATEGET